MQQHIVDYARSLGFVLEPWQEATLKAVLRGESYMNPAYTFKRGYNMARSERTPEHGLKDIHIGGEVHCKCGATFDAYGAKGSLNKWGDHMEANGLPVDMSAELAAWHRGRNEHHAGH